MLLMEKRKNIRRVQEDRESGAISYLCSAYKAGFTVKQICEMHHCSGYTLYMLLRENGVKLRRPKPWNIAMPSRRAQFKIQVRSV